MVLWNNDHFFFNAVATCHETWLIVVLSVICVNYCDSISSSYDDYITDFTSEVAMRCSTRSPCPLLQSISLFNAWFCKLFEQIITFVHHCLFDILTNFQHHIGTIGGSIILTLSIVFSTPLFLTPLEVKLSSVYFASIWLYGWCTSLCHRCVGTKGTNRQHLLVFMVLWHSLFPSLIQNMHPKVW